MKKIIALGIILIILSIAITGCGTKTFNLKNITKVELADGTTGNKIEITDPNTIQELIQPFNNNEFKKGESSKNHGGWSYRLKFYQGDKLTASIVVHGQDGSRISFNDSFYDMNDGVINADTYKNLLPNTNDLIERNLAIITTSPAYHSSIIPYIQAHQAEYDEIVALGDTALAYIISQFEIGGQTDLRGWIMAFACRDILGGDDIFQPSAAGTGQEWYDENKDIIKAMGYPK